MRVAKYGLSDGEVKWVESVLSNDAVSDDADIVRYFMRGGLTESQANLVLRHRDAYLLNIYNNGHGPLYMER